MSLTQSTVTASSSVCREGFTFTWGDHALERWEQRFKGIDKDVEFLSAQRIGKNTRKRIRKLTPTSSAKYLTGIFEGRYCLIGRSHIVFVISADSDAIVTVFHLYGTTKP